ncbi:MAG: formate dehydrogenase accessory protein FdhE [Anaerolineae bacterium]
MRKTISIRDQQVLEALAEAIEEHKDLADWLRFYEALFRAQFEAKGEMQSEIEVRDERARKWRLEGGIPQLTFDQLKLEGESFARLVERIEEVLLRYNPEWEAQRRPPDTSKILEKAREEFEKDGSLDPSLGLEALAVNFALSPYLQRAAEIIIPLLDQDAWRRPYCPVCGGQPCFAALKGEGGIRYLLCTRCYAEWIYRRLGCPFCGAEQMPYFPSEDGLYRLYVCDACKRYLKTIDLRQARRQVYLPVERLLTVSMDMAAQGEGYK